MTRLQIYLPEKMFFDLKRMSSLRNIPMVNVIREGLKGMLYPGDKTGKKYDPMRDFVGKGKSGGKTDAVREITGYYRKSIVR